MAGRSRPEPWHSFGLWLRDTRDLSATTVNGYVSRARKVLVANPDLSPEAMHTYFYGHNTTGADHNHATAWRAFAGFCASRGITVPVPVADSTPTPAQTAHRAKMKTRANVYGVPERVRAALRIMRQDGISTNKMRAMVWRFDPTYRHSRKVMMVFHWRGELAVEVPVGVVSALLAWGYPDDPPECDDPLIVEAPGRRSPMSVGRIRRVIAGRVPTATMDEIREARYRRALFHGWAPGMPDTLTVPTYESVEAAIADVSQRQDAKMHALKETQPDDALTRMVLGGDPAPHAEQQTITADTFGGAALPE